MPFDFAAQRTVETLDTVPADFKPFYVEASDGTGFTLSDDPIVKSSVKVISGLYKTVISTRKEADGLRDGTIDLSALSEYGETVEDISTKFGEALTEARKRNKGQADEQVDKLRVELGDIHKAEQTKWGEDRTGLVAQIRKLLVTTVINEALGDRAVSPTIARQVIADMVDIDTDANGNFRTIVKDAEGGARKNVADGQLFTAAELVNELAGRDDYKSLFKSEAPDGSGSTPGNMGRVIPPTNINRPPAEMSSSEKILKGLNARKAAAGKVR